MCRISDNLQFWKKLMNEAAAFQQTLKKEKKRNHGQKVIEDIFGSFINKKLDTLIALLSDDLVFSNQFYQRVYNELVEHNFPLSNKGIARMIFYNTKCINAIHRKIRLSKVALNNAYLIRSLQKQSPKQTESK